MRVERAQHAQYPDRLLAARIEAVDLRPLARCPVRSANSTKVAWRTVPRRWQWISTFGIARRNPVRVSFSFAMQEITLSGTAQSRHYRAAFQDRGRGETTDLHILFGPIIFQTGQ